MTEREREVYSVLDALNIPYERFEHGAAFTMLDCAQIDAEIPATHAKNLFLCNRQKTQYYLLILRMDKVFRTAEVSKQIGASRLSFGDNEALLSVMSVTPGAVSPMALISESARGVGVLIDGDLRNSEKLCFHPNVNTASIVIGKDDFLKFLRHCGNPLQYVSIAPPGGARAEGAL